jgi:two-component system, LytTR family, sensor kinase
MKKLMDWYLRFYPTVGTPPNRRLKIHFCYWLFYFIFSYFSLINGLSPIDRIVVSFHLVFLGAILYYIPAYFALPLLFTTKQFYLGILLFLLTYVLQHLEKLGFNTLVLKYNIHPPNGFTYKNVQEFVDGGAWGMLSPKNIFREIYFASQAIMVPFFLKFSRMLLYNSINNKKIMLEKNKVEIDYLRSQINPHFLLNTINNIYSQIITKDDTAPDSIIALSDLMKYLLHNAKEPSISLEQEINFIESYINWEKLKDSKKNNINFSKKGDYQNLQIAPLLLINFIENAFKHVGSNEGKTGIIEIQMNIKDDILEFMIENTKPNTIMKSDQKPEGGLGLKNVSQRLNVLYPQNHKLFFEETEDYFNVNLTINLNKINIQHAGHY